MNRLTTLYHSHTGHEPASCVALAGAGSNRQYYRLTGPDGQTMIGVIGTSLDENKAFCYLSRHFAARQLPVPQVYAQSEDGLCYLQQDLGGRSLYDALSKGREAGGQYSEEERALLCRTIRELPRLQVLGAEGLDFSQCYPQPRMDTTNVLFDLNYFKYCFLKPTGIDFHEMRLEQDFQQMAADLVSETDTTFLYRDFQARNVMLDADGNPWFIDFQGGRQGALQYDVASFLWQASAHYGDDLRQQLIGEYIDALSQYIKVDAQQFAQRLQLFVLFRLMQVLGAYGFRGYFERKQYFVKSIPPAIDNLRQLLASDACPYPYLREVLQALVALSQFAPKQSVAVGQASQSKYDGKGPLRVRVFSFSYKKGIPADESGNGGGYVFDCRSTHNPGRYEPYKKITGRDEAVIRFLEDDGEILTFLESVYKLADAHVERYIKRGFTDLMFCFGCTGGQHRSVYSAEHLAHHLHDKYGIRVDLCHREQGISETLE